MEFTIELTDEPGQLAGVTEAIATGGANILGAAAIGKARPAVALVVDDEEAINPEVVYIVDSTTYASLGSGSKKILYKYDWELDINEQKRTISLIDSNFADQVISEMRKGF